MGYFAGLSKQKCPSFCSAFIRAPHVSENKTQGLDVQLKCFFSFLLPPFPLNSFDLKLSFCGGEVILYFQMKSR